MRLYAVKIGEAGFYGFIIGSRSKPDSRFIQETKDKIDSVMGELVTPDWNGRISHSTAVIHDPAGDTLEQDWPDIEPNHTYLIFLILDSSPDGIEIIDKEDKKLAEIQVEGVLRAMKGDTDTRFGLVVLQDCTVKVVNRGFSGSVVAW